MLLIWRTLFWAFIISLIQFTTPKIVESLPADFETCILTAASALLLPAASPLSFQFPFCYTGYVDPSRFNPAGLAFPKPWVMILWDCPPAWSKSLHGSKFILVLERASVPNTAQMVVCVQRFCQVDAWFVSTTRCKHLKHQKWFGINPCSPNPSQGRGKTFFIKVLNSSGPTQSGLCEEEHGRSCFITSVCPGASAAPAPPPIPGAVSDPALLQPLPEGRKSFVRCVSWRTIVLFQAVLCWELIYPWIDVF